MDGRPLVQPPILPGLKSLGKSRRGNAAGAPSGVDSGGGTLQRLDLLAVLVVVALSGDRRAVVLRRMDDLTAVHGTVLRAGFVPQLGSLPAARIAVGDAYVLLNHGPGGTSERSAHRDGGCMK